MEDASARDMVGIDRIFPIAPTPDGKSYTATRNISDLVAVSGVKLRDAQLWHQGGSRAAHLSSIVHRLT